MDMLSSRRGLAGWLVVFSSLFLWIVVITIWYAPAPILDPTDKTNLFIALWWTIVCAVCVFIGLRIENIQANQ